MNAQSLTALLSGNPYPGRGIMLGKSADGQSAVAAYFIMGRSENSRNRVFISTEDGIRIQACDPAKMKDPSLVIYHPVREASGNLIVTNGDQTDTIRDALLSGGSFASALETRTFEPDPPHYTPRISGIVYPDGAFDLSILKSADGNPDCVCRYLYRYANPLPGEGRFLHTYQGDGNPLPSFAGEPVRVALDAQDPETLTEQIWNALNADNKISLYVRFQNLKTGEHREVIRNRYA